MASWSGWTEESLRDALAGSDVQMAGPPKAGATKRRRNSEAQEQRQLFMMLAHAERLDQRYRWVFHPANGEKRDKVTAKILQGLGVKRGVSDVIILYPVGGYHGMVLEMKAGNNKPTPDQAAFLADMAERGYYTHVAYSAVDAFSAIRAYLEG